MANSVPVQQLGLDLEHGRTRVRLSGTAAGERVLLVHGMTYPLEVWDPLSRSAGLANSRVARHDLYGRGEAGWDGHPLDPEVLSEQIISVLDALGWTEPVPLVSLSNSDLVLIKTACLHPERIKSLSFVAPSGFDRRLMNPRIRFLSRLPGSAAWMGGRLRRACIERMRRHRSHLDVQMEARVGEVYERSMHWAETNPHFARAVHSQISRLPTDAQLTAELSTLATRGIPIHALRFGEEMDSTDEGLLPFLNALPQAAIRGLAQGSHMGLLEHSKAVGTWIRHTLC